MTSQKDAPFNDHSFKKFLNEERLMGTRCRSCGAMSVPPGPLCSKCAGSELEWVEVSGNGTLRAFTSIAVGPPWMAEQGYNRKNPYCCGVVELDEGSAMVGLIEGVDTTSPETIMVGMPLRVKFRRMAEGQRERIVLAFEPR